ncbi:MAG: hypothetical protein ACNI28_10580 [Arcobacter sp.]|uniref:hypothetical protein n=1 Tax=Arcobacter sp. TaxID=1872629 RepID=UPI003AFF87B9
MSKITLEIEDKNLETVLTILKSIKPELISEISVDDKTLGKKAFKYVPKKQIKKRSSIQEDPIKGAISLKNDFKSNI